MAGRIRRNRRFPLEPAAAGKAAVERRRAAAIARLHTIEPRAGCIPSTTMASSSSSMGKRGVAMGPAPLLMTAHEYFKTPETVKPMELAFGALRVADAPSAYHQSIVVELFRALDQ